MASRKSRLPPSKHRYETPNEPPDSLTPAQFIGRITKAHGNAIYTVEISSKSDLVVELPTKFLNAIWVRRGGYVLVETDGYNEGKVNGGIIEVITDEKPWRKMSYWYLLQLSSTKL
jgi:probable RNA-binding protein EIF1AD